jgi:hypothetical protein
VISAEKGMDGLAEVHRDVVKVVLGAEDPEDDPAISKPGEKLQQLKEELQQQIAQRRAEEWRRRLHEQQLDNEEEGESLASILCSPQLMFRHVKPRPTNCSGHIEVRWLKKALEIRLSSFTQTAISSHFLFVASIETYELALRALFCRGAGILSFRILFVQPY